MRILARAVGRKPDYKWFKIIIISHPLLFVFPINRKQGELEGEGRSINKVQARGKIATGIDLSYVIYYT